MSWISCGAAAALMLLLVQFRWQGGSDDRALARRRPDAVVVAIANGQEYAGWPAPRVAHEVRLDAVNIPGGGLAPLLDAGHERPGAAA